MRVTYTVLFFLLGVSSLYAKPHGSPKGVRGGGTTDGSGVSVPSAQSATCPPSSGACTREYLPVICGENDCEYDNPCIAEHAGFNVTTDCTPASTCPVPSEGPCILLYYPVQCGVEGCVYDNYCLAERAGYNGTTDCFPVAECSHIPPDATYVALPGECALLDYNWTCADDEIQFDDTCGCGCKKASCNNVSPTNATYVAGLGSDVCNNLTSVVCGDDEVVFSNDCGCGCEPRECSYLPANASYIGGSDCKVINFMCIQGHVGFTNPCGCGCKPYLSLNSTYCQDLLPPGASYITDASNCPFIQFKCSGNNGGGSFYNECGCGCYPGNA